MSSPGRAKSLVVYLVCEPETPALAQAAVEGGADVVELGIPFSDPLAEGPTIRLASERAPWRTAVRPAPSDAAPAASTPTRRTDGSSTKP